MPQADLVTALFTLSGAAMRTTTVKPRLTGECTSRSARRLEALAPSRSAAGYAVKHVEVLTGS